MHRPRPKHDPNENHGISRAAFRFTRLALSANGSFFPCIRDINRDNVAWPGPTSGRRHLVVEAGCNTLQSQSSARSMIRRLPIHRLRRAEEYDVTCRIEHLCCGFHLPRVGSRAATVIAIAIVTAVAVDGASARSVEQSRSVDRTHHAFAGVHLRHLHPTHLKAAHMGRHRYRRPYWRRQRSAERPSAVQYDRPGSYVLHGPHF